jgi:hypothetical protein
MPRTGAGRGNAGRRSMPQTFFGNTDGMKGNVFQCHGESTSKQQFLKTVGVLEEHINKTFDYPQDIASVCKSFAVVPLTMPDNLDKATYDTDMGRRMIWETSINAYMRRTKKMSSKLCAIYAIVWGQSSPMMQSKLESLVEYEARSTDCDCVWLLKKSWASRTVSKGHRTYSSPSTTHGATITPTTKERNSPYTST